MASQLFSDLSRSMGCGTDNNLGGFARRSPSSVFQSASRWRDSACSSPGHTVDICRSDIQFSGKLQ
jgi:hypothetical protein